MLERRYFQGVQLRAEVAQPDAPRVVRGYAAMFNERTMLWPGVYEEIAPEFFVDVMEDDVRALKNHDSNYLLGRTKSGTLRIAYDEKGLMYDYDSPDSSYARDLLVSIDRGDLDQSSFGFWPDYEHMEVSTLPDGSTLIRQKRAVKLYDVSPVTFPAYEGTSVRSAEQAAATKEALISVASAKTSNQARSALIRAYERYADLLNL